MEKDGIYTMEQFKEMYDNAVVKTIEVMNKKLDDNNEDIDLISSFTFMVAFKELEKILFKNEESEL